MGQGVTVIFGTIRTKPSASSMAGLSGPPAGSWPTPCSPVTNRRTRARGPQRKPVEDKSSKGHDFTRRVRTFVGE